MKWTELPREIHLVLLFGGTCLAVQECGVRGLWCKSFEVKNDPWENSDCLMGALYMTFLVWETRVDGVVWACPECKSLLNFLSRSTHGRLIGGRTILGNDDDDTVKHANCYSVFLSWLLYAAFLRRVHWAWEHPLNSLVWQFPWVSSCVQHCNGFRFTTSLGEYGGVSVKQLEVFTTLPEALVSEFLVRKAVRATQTQPLYTVSAGWCNGSHARLKSSQAYPREFAIALAELTGCLHPVRIDPLDRRFYQYYLDHGIDVRPVMDAD